MGPLSRTVNIACALALIGVGSYLLLSTVLAVVQHRGFHGRLGIMAAVMTVFGGYWLWVDFIKPLRKASRT